MGRSWKEEDFSDLDMDFKSTDVDLHLLPCGFDPEHREPGRRFGEDGYVQTTREIVGATRTIAEGQKNIPMRVRE